MDFGAIWSFLTTYPEALAALITFALTTIWQLTTRVFAARPRLSWGQTSNNHFLVPFMPPATEEDQHPVAGLNNYRSRNIWLYNGGRAIAEDVELVFNWRPQHMERFPHLPATEDTQPDGRYVVTIPRLNPKEGVNFSLLSLNAEHPEILHVRCKGYAAKQLRFVNQRVYPSVVTILVAVDMLLGAFAAVYLVLLLIFWLSGV